MTPSWRWNHARSRYEAKLEDGSELRAVFHRRGAPAGRWSGFWSASVLAAWDHLSHEVDDQGASFADGDAAKSAELDWYTRHRPRTKTRRRHSSS